MKNLLVAMLVVSIMAGCYSGVKNNTPTFQGSKKLLPVFASNPELPKDLNWI